MIGRELLWAAQLLHIYTVNDGGSKSGLQVTCVGHIIGAVLADTQEHSRRAAKAVKIKYEELKPIVTIQVRRLRSAAAVISEPSDI